MLVFITFKWKQPGYVATYRSEYVNILEASIRKHVTRPHRFVCVTDDADGIDGATFPLWSDCSDLPNIRGKVFPSCYRRLRLFDIEIQKAMGIEPGDRLVSIDLDTMVVGNIDHLFDQVRGFNGWRVRGSYHLRVVNGSLWSFPMGYRPDIWSDFDPDTSPLEAKTAHYLGSDQAWLSYKFQGQYSGWTDQHGIYSFPQVIMRSRRLPPNARMIMFHGRLKPWDNQLKAIFPPLFDQWSAASIKRC